MSRPLYRRRWFWIVTAVVVIGGYGALISDEDGPEVGEAAIEPLMFEVVSIGRFDANGAERAVVDTFVTSPVELDRIEATVEAAISRTRADDRQLDVIRVNLFSDELLARAGRSGDIATAVWGYNGTWSEGLDEMVQSNNRNNHRIEMEPIREDLLAYLEQRAKDETRFGLTESERRTALVAINDAAKDANGDHNEELLAAALAEYGLTRDDWSSILSEMVEENWP